jgi:hypothetical protein
LRCLVLLLLHSPWLWHYVLLAEGTAMKPRITVIRAEGARYKMSFVRRSATRRG